MFGNQKCLFEHSELLFKKALTREQIEEGYHPTIKRSENGTYASTLSTKLTKLNTTGRREVSYWTPKSAKREAPEDWRRVTVVPALEISFLWQVGREIGWWTLQCNHLRVYEESSSCPFAADEVKEEKASL